MTRWLCLAVSMAILVPSGASAGSNSYILHCKAFWGEELPELTAEQRAIAASCEQAFDDSKACWARAEAVKALSSPKLTIFTGCEEQQR